MSNQLLTTKVPRSLESKTKILGFEIGDILLILMQLSVLNLLFGHSTHRYLIVWGSTFLLAGFLYFAKRGKPDGFIQHWTEYHSLSPTFYANSTDDQYEPFSFKEEGGEE